MRISEIKVFNKAEIGQNDSTGFAMSTSPASEPENAMEQDKIINHLQPSDVVVC